MTRIISYSATALALMISIVPITNSGCVPKYPDNKVVIVSPVGEVTQDTRAVGDLIKYKIYFRNQSTDQADIAIIDMLDANLSDITVFNDGKYDEQDHSVSWEVPKVAAGTGGSVEFEAVIGKANLIYNQAMIKVSGQPDIKTNKVTTTVCGTPELGWIPFDKISKPGELPRSAMKDETTVCITINFDIPGMFAYEVEVDKIVYQRLSIPGHAALTDVGKPELPIIGQIIEVPYGVNFDIEIIETESIPLKCYNVYPAQEPRFDLKPDHSEFSLDAASYTTDEFYPERLAVIGHEDIGVIRGHRIVFLKVHPVQYNPVTREIRAFSNIEVRLNYDKPAQIEPVALRVKSQAFEELLQRSVLNYKDAALAATGVAMVDPLDYTTDVRNKGNNPLTTHANFNNIGNSGNPIVRLQDLQQGKGYETKVVDGDVTLLARGDLRVNAGNHVGDIEQGCDYLIITHGTFYQSTDPNNPVVLLQHWKQEKGYETKVVDIANISGGTADDIKNYIQHAYDKWYPVPTYILLVGDSNFIPTNYKTPHSEHNNTKIGTDLYYATVDGTDYFPDLFIGRLPVDTLAEAGNIINKIISYEQNPPANANFYSNATLIALFEDDTDYPGDPWPEDGREDRPWIENMEEIRAYLANNGYAPTRIYATSSGFPGDPFSDDPEKYENGDSLPDELTVAGNPGAGIPGFPWNGSTADINNAIANGTFLVTYRDHGARDGWSSHIGFDLWDAAGLTNGNLNPVVLSIACQNGWFDNETDDDAMLGTSATGNNDECFGEHFILNASGGAVAFLGATRSSPTGWNDFLMFGLHQAMWPDFAPNPPLSATYPAIPQIDTGPLLRMGQIHTFGKIYMANAYTESNMRKIEFEMYTLFGDPEMPVWTEAPDNFNVDHPEGIGATGTQDFIVKVTDASSGNPVQNAVVALTRGDTIMSTQQTNSGGISRFTLSAPGAGDLSITVTALKYMPYQGTIEINTGGATLNRLEPQDGIAGQVIHVGGQNFSGTESVDIYLGSQLMTTKNATGGTFGQSGVENVDIQIPSPYDLGPVNVWAHGQSSDRYAIDVFWTRTANPIDLYTYSQWDNSTWSLQSDGALTWNNPEIQLYDSSHNPVDSNNLVVGRPYTIEARVHNDTNFDADNVKVAFKWANFGLGQPDTVWELIDTDDLDVPDTYVATAEVEWSPPSTGHLCILVEIYHIEDIKESNNTGQENLHVGPTSSPAKVAFDIWNPTKESAYVYLELRQLRARGQEYWNPLWRSSIIHPDPQLIKPGEKTQGWVIINPGVGTEARSAEFALTGYINGKMIGGVNFIIQRR